MLWYCFFIFFIHYLHASDLLIPKDFLTIDMLHNEKPVLIKDHQWKKEIPAHPVILLSDKHQEIFNDTREIKHIKKVPYSINNDHDDNYLVIKRGGIWNGYGFKRFNRKISLLLLYLALLKKEYYDKDVFIIPQQLHSQIFANSKFRKIFGHYGFFITEKSLQYLQQKQSKISTISLAENAQRKTLNHYVHLHKITPFKLLACHYNFYHASLLKNYYIDPTHSIVLKPGNLLEKKYLDPSLFYIFEKKPIMLEYCQKNSFSLFKIQNENIPSLMQDLSLIDFFFQIRHAQITGNNALKYICIIEKRFKEIQKEEAFCEFLELFNIFCLQPKRESNTLKL